MYCSHCMNTSPNLLARLKINLLMLRNTNRELKGRVESILEYGLGLVDGSNRHALAGRPDGEQEDVEGKILGQRLIKLNQLRSKRKNNRTRYRTAQLQTVVESKRQLVARLKEEKKQVSVLDRKAEKMHVKAKTAVIVERKFQLSQIDRVLVSSRGAKLESLREWFMVRKRDSYDFPYSIAFCPVISLKNFYRLPPMVAWSSIAKMSELVELISRVMLYKLPCEGIRTPAPSSNPTGKGDKTLEDAYEDDNNVAECITRLLINIIQLARHADLMSKSPVDLAWMLDQLDIDTIFYHMVTSTRIDTKPIAQHWTYHKLLSVVSEALQLSVYAASPASRQTATGALANNSDHWFLVG